MDSNLGAFLVQCAFDANNDRVFLPDDKDKCTVLWNIMTKMQGFLSGDLPNGNRKCATDMATKLRDNMLAVHGQTEGGK